MVQSPYIKIYSNLPYLDQNHDFVKDLADFAILTGHRRRRRRWVYGSYYQEDGVRKYREGHYTDLEPVRQDSFEHNFTGQLYYHLHRLKDCSDQERETFQKLDLPIYGSYTLLDRCRNGSYSPALMALCLKVVGAPYKFVVGDILSRRGAIEVDWTPPKKDKE